MANIKLRPIDTITNISEIAKITSIDSANDDFLVGYVETAEGLKLPMCWNKNGMCEDSMTIVV